MVLVDSSVLVSFLRGARTSETRKLDEIIEKSTPYGICSIIYQELLQGVRTENEFKLLKLYLDTQRFFELNNGRESYAAAAKMYFNCQKAGITIRKSADLLIAQIAIENNLRLLHNDKDFRQLMTIEKRLVSY